LLDKPLGQISTADLEKLLVAPMLQSGKSPGSIERALGLFSSMWGWAKRQGLVSGPNPKSKVKRPVEDNRRDRFLTRVEAVRLLQALKERSAVTHDMAVMALFCGLRAGECRALTWADIDFENGLIFVKDSKNSFNRHAFITAEVREMLLGRFQGQAKSAKVFVGPQGGESYCQISTHFRETVKALGFNEGLGDRRQRICFHSLRHTFASWLTQKGQPIYTVGKLLGHKAIKHTERYAHLAPKEQRAAALRLEGLLK
jgi:integrase